MTMLFKVSAVGIITLLFNLLVKQYKQEYAFAVSLSGGAVIIYIICKEAVTYISLIKGYFSDAALNYETISALIKAVGIGYITEFSAATARDFGQTSLSAKIVFAGKLTVVAMSLPFIEKLISLAVSFIG